MPDHNLATDSSAEQRAATVSASAARRARFRTPLAWFPHLPKEWRAHTESLSFEEAGALMYIYGFAWEESEPPCTIADSPTLFDRLLGSRREALEPMVRKVFVPDAELPGRLRSPWLSALYAEQLGKYNDKKSAGKQSGKLRSRKALNSVRTAFKRRSNAVATELEQNVNRTEACASFEKETPVGGTSHELPPTTGAPDVAAVGRGGATTAPPSPTGEQPNRAPAPAPAPMPVTARGESPRDRRTAAAQGRTALMREGARPNPREPDGGPTTAELERWVHSRPDAEAVFTQTWQSMAEEDPDAERGFLRVPALRSTWRALRDAPLPAHAATSGAA